MKILFIILFIGIVFLPGKATFCGNNHDTEPYRLVVNFDFNSFQSFLTTELYLNTIESNDFEFDFDFVENKKSLLLKRVKTRPTGAYSFNFIQRSLFPLFYDLPPPDLYQVIQF